MVVAFARNDVAGQIHGVVQQTEHIDRGRSGLRFGTIEDEMAALSSSPSNVKHPESLADVVAFPGSGNVRAIRQCLDGGGQGIGIE